MTTHTKRALVTGASSGIGQATVEALTAQGWDVIATARRGDRLAALAERTGAVPLTADLTDDASVAALAGQVAELGPLDSLVHVAGGAKGTDSVEAGSVDDWKWMYEVNVLSAQRLVASFLPQLRATAAAAGHADLLFVTSTAGQIAYEGGAGYNAAKAGETMLVRALRLELNGEPLRVIEVAPGMVHTDEFTLNRIGGDKAAAEALYEGVDHPLVAADVADVIAYALGAPGHVNLDLITMRPVAQSAQHKLFRGPLTVRHD